jgi:hypothetical protein
MSVRWNRSGEGYDLTARINTVRAWSLCGPRAVPGRSVSRRMQGDLGAQHACLLVELARPVLFTIRPAGREISRIEAAVVAWTASCP